MRKIKKQAVLIKENLENELNLLSKLGISQQSENTYLHALPILIPYCKQYFFKVRNDDTSIILELRNSNQNKVEAKMAMPCSIELMFLSGCRVKYSQIVMCNEDGNTLLMNNGTCVLSVLDKVLDSFFSLTRTPL